MSMISAEVQRTLVKSPPELWAELSDEDALARHLRALGEIKITTTKPGQTVEWEAEAAHGKIELKPSGWGTKVTLSITREAHIDARRTPGAEQSQEPLPKAEVEPKHEAAVEPKPEVAMEPEPEAVVEQRSHAMAEPPAPEEEAVAPTVEKPARRRGFFARLLRRRFADATVDVAPTSAAKGQETVGQTEAVEQSEAGEEPVAADERQVAAEITPRTEPAIPELGPVAESIASAEPAIATEQGAAAKRDATKQATDLEPPSANLAAELAVAEQEIVQQTTELLNGVLDRLGAAHHRPFSRA
jgi:hypothetical protein